MYRPEEHCSIDDLSRYFEDRVEFFDEIVGEIPINQIERDCIDAPEFQRLFRISQLGLVDLVYHCANHTRGIHSIGACHKAKQLVRKLNKNTPHHDAARARAKNPPTVTLHITAAEACLISLAGLLHDIPHGPLSHDIEKKTHRYNKGSRKVRSHYGPYDKHDDFARNPALYLMLFDVEHSVLARVLRHHSPMFFRLLRHEASLPTGSHLSSFTELANTTSWPEVEGDLLASLLFHLLVFEEHETALATYSAEVATTFHGAPSNWGIGPPGLWRELHQAWYQPFRHDIIGDTLSADLLDYLPRDARRLGMRSTLDVKLLAYYVLVELKPPKESTLEWGALARCAIDLNDYKRGVIRSERINDIFRLLDFRHEIHEKAVYHRVVQSAIAMTARAVALTGDQKPSVASLYGIGAANHALLGDEHFLDRLSSIRNDGGKSRVYQSIAQKLVERRVYRPLMIIPGDHAHDLFSSAGGVANPSDEVREEDLRLLGALLDSTYFAPLFCLVSWSVERLLEHSLESVDDIDRFIEKSVCSGSCLEWAMRVMPRRVVIWTTPYKQLYKDPAIVVRAGQAVGRIDQLLHDAGGPEHQRLRASVKRRLQAGLADSESRYAAMWKVYVFVSDGLFYAGGLARLIREHPCREDRAAHKRHLEEAQDCIIRAIQVAWEWWARRAVPDGVDLNGEMPPKTFVELLRLYTSHKTWYQGLYSRVRADVSAVDVEQYLHLESDECCRDIRYKFDRSADIASAVASCGLEARIAENVREFLRAARVDVGSIGQEELTELVAHLGRCLHEVSLDNVEEAARDGVRLNADRLRELWLKAELDCGGGNEEVASASLSQFARGDEPSTRRAKNRREGARSTGGLRLLDAADPTGEGRPEIPDRKQADSEPSGS